MDLSQKGYSHEEVLAALRMVKGDREISFRYFLLDNNHNKLRELNTIKSGNISMSAFSNIKRTGKFQMKDESYEIQSYYTWKEMSNKEWSDL
ncbi:hypothetical protein [Halobacillus sp. H74]|uniref:hypothetical protein n=1 Tax=Halobacillus sp. H74 TaxID=3457436 RepID=UPI003FCC8982